MKTAAILQSNYIPWKGYFDIMGMADEFIVYDEVQYTKNDWRNRNRIKTRHGLSWLTIPVLQGSLRQRICETFAVDNRWRKRHWHSISQSYSRSPYFREYRSLFEELYLGSEETCLSSINLAFLTAINGILGIPTRISSSRDYAPTGGASERLVDLCRRVGATEYLSGPSARNYLEMDLFAAAGIAVVWMDYSGYPEYPQPYPPFEHRVSVVDLVFALGPDAPGHMKSRVRTAAGARP